MQMQWTEWALSDTAQQKCNTWLATIMQVHTGTIVEFPHRWRRFPIQEEAVYTGMSLGARHPQAEALGEALDTLVRLAQEYKASMQARVAREAASASRLPGVGKALQDHVARLERCIDILDTDALDQLREIVNRVTTLELRVSGKFV